MNSLLILVLLLVVPISTSLGAETGGGIGRKNIPGASERSPWASESVGAPRCQCINGMWYLEGGDPAQCSGGGADSSSGRGGRGRALSSLLFPDVCREPEPGAVAQAPRKPAYDVRWRDAAVISLPSDTASVTSPSTHRIRSAAGAAGGLSAAGGTAPGLSPPLILFGGPLRGSDPYGILHDILTGSKDILQEPEKEQPVSERYPADQTGIAISVGLTTTTIPVHLPPASPVLLSPENGSTRESGSVGFAWNAVANATSYRIQVSASPRFTAPIIDGTTSAPSFTPIRELAFGMYYWKVLAIDKLNFRSEWSPAWSVMVDSEGPVNTTEATLINSGAAVTGNAAVSLAISARKFNGVTGYYLSENPGKPAAGDAAWVEIPSATSYSAVLPFTLSAGDGKKTVFVWFRDKAGHLSRPRSESIVLDTLPPTAAVSGQPPALTNSTSAVFSISSTEPGSTFQCALDGGAFAACTTPMVYGVLADGAHTFSVKATDRAGNSGAAAVSYSWTIDTTLPRTAITSQPRIWTNVPSAGFSFSSPKPEIVFQCSLDGGAYGDCGSPVAYTDLADGIHTFAVRAADKAGNTDPSPASYTWTIDTTPFGTAITDHPDDPSNSAEAGFAFTAQKTGTTFLCKIDASLYSSCTSTMTYRGLAEGKHMFTVKAVDALGNEDLTPATYSWAVSLPPVNETPSSFINKGGAYFTQKSEVKLTLRASSNKAVAGYFVSESPIPPEASSEGWVHIKPIEEFFRIVPYTLSEGRGKKTVYVWFKDIDENVSEAKSDTIYLFNANYFMAAFILLQVATIIAM